MSTAGTRDKALLSASTRRAKAMADPKRASILRHLVETGVKAASEISIELGIPLNQCSYHVGKLAEFECIELVKTEIVRGAEKSYWRAIEIHYVSTPDWQNMEEWRKPSALHDCMTPVVGDFNHALDAGTFGDDGRWHLMRNPLKSVDQQGFDDLLALHMELFERSNEIQREAAERLRESGEESISVTSSSQCFEVHNFAGRFDTSVAG